MFWKCLIYEIKLLEKTETKDNFQNFIYAYQVLMFCTIFNSITIYKQFLFMLLFVKWRACLFTNNIKASISGWFVLLPLPLPSHSYELFQTSKAIWCLHDIINTQRSYSIFQNKVKREIKYGNFFIL